MSLQDRSTQRAGADLDESQFFIEEVYRLPSALVHLSGMMHMLPPYLNRLHDVPSVHLCSIVLYPASWLMARLVRVQGDTSYPRSKAIASTNKGIRSGLSAFF